jgi:nicotinamidase-related amidase
LAQDVETLLASPKFSSVDTFVVAGIETHVCIVASVVDLVARRLNVHVVADAVSSRTTTDRIFALERMKKIGNKLERLSLVFTSARKPN